MLSSVYWIESHGPGRLAIMARPRAGEWLDDEVAGWRAQAIDVVVSLLEHSEIAELDLREEAELCRARDIEFIQFAIPDRGVPASRREARTLARRLTGMLSDGKAVAIHCRAGIGRSSLIAACALVCAGVGPIEAFDRIAKARGVAVPDTEQQRDWVVQFVTSVE
ncbi:MAG: protein-tyrosine phosphatase family protein [Reyranellaceae bacterium]